MKINRLFQLSSGALVLSLAFSAHAKTTSEDFNSLIEENSAAQKELTKKMATQLKTDKIKKREKPDFLQVGEEVLGKGTTENVVATTTQQKGKYGTQKKSLNSAMEKQNFNRLSQELRDIKE